MERRKIIFIFIQKITEGGGGEIGELSKEKLAS